MRRSAASLSHLAPASISGIRPTPAAPLPALAVFDTGAKWCNTPAPADRHPIGAPETSGGQLPPRRPAELLQVHGPDNSRLAHCQVPSSTPAAPTAGHRLHDRVRSEYWPDSADS